MTGPPIWGGRAISAANSDLDYLTQAATDAQASANTALANAAANLARIVALEHTVPQPAFGRSLTTLQSYINNDQTLWVKDYGVVGDGVVDDTINFQNALTQAALANRILYCGSCVIMVTAPLTFSGPGLVFDRAGYGNSGDPGIYARGAGFTVTPVLTVSGSQHAWVVSVYGDGQSVVGALVFSNPQAGVYLDTRVYNFAGPQCVITEMFDCLFGTISCELGGTTAAGGAAFQVLPGGGTSNMSHILRLQVEQANGQAIFIDPGTLCCVFDAIHSERLAPNAGVTSWSLQGASCGYNNVRLHSSGTSANATALLLGEHCQYNVLRIEGDIVVQVAGASSTSITITDANIQGTLENVANQTGIVEILGSTIATMTVDPYGIRCLNTQISTLTIGVGPNPIDPTQARFTNCDITTLVTGASLLASATFSTCRITEGNNLLKGSTVLNDCVVTFAGTCTPIGQLYAKGTTFKGNLTPNGWSVFDDGCVCTGTVTGPGPPASGTWSRGQRSINLVPATASDQGWLCTVAGTPGTWVAVGGALAHALTFGTHITPAASTFDGSVARTIATDATDVNTASTIVARDASGNFAAGTITAALSGNATTATAATTAGTVTTAAQPAITSVGSLVGLTIASGSDVQLGRAYVAGVVVSTGTIQVKDSTGTVYNLLVHT